MEEELIDNSTVTLNHNNESWIFCVTSICETSLVSCFRTSFIAPEDHYDISETFSSIFLSDFKENEARKFLDFDDEDEDDIKKFERSIQRSIDRCFKNSEFTYVEVNDVPEVVFLEFDAIMREYEREQENEEIDPKTLN